ncbi:MAG: DNA recombination protein RmuC, partial [Candidatus Dadabacteria bacterium]|nr:DNA recombination protein RmuC [Candidatus Dadabacteria bacterium]NIQ15308.1 DNA recombination protein RmuC [Candidatus Dadabacteria bacterium]
MQSILTLQQSNPYLFPICSLILLVLFLFTLYKFLKRVEYNKNISKDLENNRSELFNKQYELQSKDKELNQVRSRLGTLEKELNSSISNNTNLLADKKAAESRLEEKEKIIFSCQDQISEAKAEIKKLNSKIITDEGLISELKTTIDKEREMSDEKLRLLNEAKDKLTVEFENLGNKIFEEKSKKFADQSKTNIETLLNPLREQLKDFDKKISDTHEKDTKERISLHVQIEQLKNLNERISEDAINLTNALKGQTKTQGTWGEVVLEKVLEMSGLTNGREYTTQDSFKSWHGKNYRPDVVIQLPEGKQVVIDAKVSLNAYEKYISIDDANEKAKALKNHLISINNHIKGLSIKNYEDLEGINSLNY